MNSLKILNCGSKALSKTEQMSLWSWILQKESEIKQSASSFI